MAEAIDIRALNERVEKELRPLPPTIHTIHSSHWITDVNINSKSIQFLEENIGENLCEFG